MTIQIGLELTAVLLVAIQLAQFLRAGQAKSPSVVTPEPVPVKPPSVVTAEPREEYAHAREAYREAIEARRFPDPAGPTIRIEVISRVILVGIQSDQTANSLPNGRTGDFPASFPVLNVRLANSFRGEAPNDHSSRPPGARQL